MVVTFLIGLIMFLAILIFSAFIIAGWIFGTYNNLVTADQDIKTQWSNIKTEYQRRADLFFNLAASVKSYAKFEKETMTQVIQARGGNFGKTPQQEQKTMQGLDSFFNRLMVVFERYPKLQAIESYKELSDELKMTENRVNIARTEFNDVVREYNLIVKHFPSNIIARWWNFEAKDYYLNEEYSEKTENFRISKSGKLDE
jgi:LemA protein